MPDNLDTYLKEHARDYWYMLTPEAKAMAAQVKVEFTESGTRAHYDAASNMVSIPQDASPNTWMHEATHSLQTLSPFGNIQPLGSINPTAQNVTQQILTQLNLKKWPGFGQQLEEDYDPYGVSGRDRDLFKDKLRWNIGGMGAEAYPMALSHYDYQPWRLPEEQRQLYEGIFLPDAFTGPLTMYPQPEGEYQNRVPFEIIPPETLIGAGAKPLKPTTTNIPGISPVVPPSIGRGRGTPPPYIRPTPPPRPPRTRPKPRRR